VAGRLPAPRWQTPLPPGVVGSWGPDVERYASSVLGLTLDRWQRRVLNRALATAEDGRLAHSVYLASTSRQQGKTAGVRSLIGWALTERTIPEWQSIMGLAHDKKQARIPYKAVLTDLQQIARRLPAAERGGLSLTQYLGIRSGMHGRRRTYDYLSREARDSARGESHDLVLFDEVRTQRDFDTWAAIEPTMTARPDPLAFLISTAGDDRSVLLRSLFDRGLRIIDGVEPPGRFGMTWYAASDDLAPNDPRAILAASPAIAEGRVPIGPVLESYASMPPAQYRMERLNLWSEALDEWLPAGVWPAASRPQPAADGRRVIAVEVTPTWSRATVSVALATAEGAWVGVAAELVASRLGLGSIAPEAVVAMAAQVAAELRPHSVAWVGTAAIAPHLDAWAELASVDAVRLGAREIRAASELFRGELVGGRLTHRDDPLLASQVRTARPSSPIEGGDWYLSVRQSVGDVDAIRAAAWAAWACIAPPEREVQIFV
jgi:hypothetical protein